MNKGNPEYTSAKDIHHEIFQNFPQKKKFWSFINKLYLLAVAPDPAVIKIGISVSWYNHLPDKSRTKLTFFNKGRKIFGITLHDKYIHTGQIWNPDGDEVVRIMLPFYRTIDAFVEHVDQTVRADPAVQKRMADMEKAWNIGLD